MAATGSLSTIMEFGNQAQAYSRKQKSLGLLCSNFMALYDRSDVEAIGLDDAARRLGVERRRIYDIVNVLESVGVLVRKAKNQYSWIGFSGIPKALVNLKDDALQQASGNAPDDSKIWEDDDEDEFTEEKLSQTTNGSQSSSQGKARSENKREKSLGQLTQNFVKLFLTTDVDTISLDEAAKLLLGDGHDASQMKNNAAKVRRLYDIGNVLCSMNLIEKTHHSETRKPAFRWLGINGKPNNGIGTVTVAIPASSKQSKKRTFGTDLTNLEKKPRLVSCVTKKSLTDQNEDLKECNLAAQKQLGASKEYVFGPFQPGVAAPNLGRNAEERQEKKVHDWERLAYSFRPHYHNQALHELFDHFKEAWDSWNSEVTLASNVQVPYKSFKQFF